jgi:hypothetical protein
MGKRSEAYSARRICRDFERKSPGALGFHHGHGGVLCYCDGIHKNSWSHNAENYESGFPIPSPRPYIVLNDLKAEVTHVNWIKVIPSLYLHRPKSPYFPPSDTPIYIDQMAQEFQVPWKHKYVVISKKTHPAKGWHVRVIDAIRPINPSSKPTLVVQYEHISPSGPQQDQLSYNDIVDAVYVSCIPPCQRMLTVCRTRRKLYAHFHKKHPFYFEMSHVDVPMLAPNNGSVTPAWSSSSLDMSLSPAWNPSLRTPLIVDSGNEAPVTSTSTYPQHASAAVPVTVMLSPAHPLLDPHLIEKAARAKVSDRLHLKPDATVSILAGQNNDVTIRQWWWRCQMQLL